MDWKGLLLWVDLVLLWIPAALIIHLAVIHGVSAVDTATLPASQPPSSSLQQGVDYHSSPAQQRLTDRPTARRQPRAATSLEVYLWPNATVPYVLDGLNDEEQRNVLTAMEHWSTYTCLKFVNRTVETNYIHFHKWKSYCHSQVGRSKGPYSQPIFVNSFCLANPGYIIHELGHVIGFWHEHQRPDRDDYVEVKYENVPHRFLTIFNMIPMKEIDGFDVPYDFGSIMHIKSTDYSQNGKPTLVPKVNYTGEIGQRRQLSRQDIIQTNLLYQCNMTNMKFPPPMNFTNATTGPNGTNSTVVTMTTSATTSSIAVSSIAASNLPSPTQSNRVSPTLISSLQPTPSLVSQSTSSVILSSSSFVTALPCSTAPLQTSCQSQLSASIAVLPRASPTLSFSSSSFSDISTSVPLSQSVPPSTAFSSSHSLSSSSPSLSPSPSLSLSPSPSLSPSLSHSSSLSLLTSSLTPLSRLPSATPTMQKQQINTSHSVTFRSLRSIEPCWIACSDRCSLKRCLGKNSSPLTACKSSIFMIERTNGENGPVFVGDILLLRSYYNNGSTLACDKPTRVCKPTSMCGVVGLHQNDLCSEYKLRISIDGRAAGTPVYNGDIVSLFYVDSRPNRVDSVGCNNFGTHKCKRRSTKCVICDPAEKFEVSLF